MRERSLSLLGAGSDCRDARVPLRHWSRTRDTIVLSELGQLTIEDAFYRLSPRSMIPSVMAPATVPLRVGAAAGRIDYSLLFHPKSQQGRSHPSIVCITFDIDRRRLSNTGWSKHI